MLNFSEAIKRYVLPLTLVLSLWPISATYGVRAETSLIANPIGAITTERSSHSLIPFSAPDSFEPDNTSAQARLINSGNIQSHSIDPLGDNDWVQFTLNYTSTVILETSGAAFVMQMRLYNSSLILLESNTSATIDRLCNVDSLSPGTYYLQINDSGNNNTIATYNLRFTSDPCLSVQANPLSLTLFAVKGGANPAPKAFILNASKAGTINWTASDNASWLNLSQTSGAVSTTAPATITVSANIAGLNQNTYTGQISINAGDPIPRRVTVTLKVGPSAPGCVGIPTDVMLVLDKSGSMAGRPVTDAKAAASAFTRQLNLIFDQMGLVSFNSVATLDHPLTKNNAALQAAITALSAGGNTDIAGAIRAAANELASIRHNPNNPPVMILMSDGQQTVTGNPIIEANLSKSQGIYIISIGLGSADTTTLRAIASSPSDYYYAPNSGVLANIFSTIAGTVGCDPQLFLPIIRR